MQSTTCMRGNIKYWEVSLSGSAYVVWSGQNTFLPGHMEVTERELAMQTAVEQEQHGSDEHWCHGKRNRSVVLLCMWWYYTLIWARQNSVSLSNWIRCKPNFQSVFQRKMRAHCHPKSRTLRCFETSSCDYASMQCHPRRTESSTTQLRKPQVQ